MREKLVHKKGLTMHDENHLFALSEVEESELRWALTQAAGEIGMSSNFGSMVHALEMGSATPAVGAILDDGMTDKLFEKIELERRVRSTLATLPDLERKTLLRVYGVSANPVHEFGKLTCLAPYTPTACARGAPTAHVWLHNELVRARSGDVASRLLVRRIRSEAAVLLAGADELYHNSRRPR